MSQGTALAEATRCTLSRWTGLTRFLDGRIETDGHPNSQIDDLLP